jgi:hypothetical protein
MLTTLAIISSLTTIAVNAYTLWTIRKFISSTAKKAADEVKDIVKKI